MLFATTWMNLEGIKLTELSQTKTLYDITYVWNIKNYNKLVNITKKKETHGCREQSSGHQWGESRGEGQVRVKGLRYKLLCIK